MPQKIFSEPESPWKNSQVLQHSQRLFKSFHHWTGRSLLRHSASLSVSSAGSLEGWAQELFEAPFVVVSHGIEADPIFNYGNRQALLLWELDWQSFTQMPSCQSATPIERDAREKFLVEVKQEGYTQSYCGIRTSSTGKQFWIENVILWNVLDEQHQFCGQAAMFANWQFIDSLLNGDI